MIGPLNPFPASRFVHLLINPLSLVGHQPEPAKTGSLPINIQIHSPGLSRFDSSWPASLPRCRSFPPGSHYGRLCILRFLPGSRFWAFCLKPVRLSRNLFCPQFWAPILGRLFLEPERLSFSTPLPLIPRSVACVGSKTAVALHVMSPQTLTLRVAAFVSDLSHS
ncbi:hypothetical protein MAPG_09061 [Magnaporthiopsis poae ATCC 64411]|uniref:Uncharacterized protein n=1 Tax=Magnaporthiopsis poae (strain ATCC 64411 / 73-15) TaxID=644358 RepID=A0A0C4E8Y9_MAGP6|nr:hypothetical protein MAPG_09061 [Magnaporthiopsis poae ATCC 64411]